MVNGPPCPQCGYPLRWFAAQNAWGCDREQKMFPPQAVAMPQAPQGAPRTSRGKWYALGGLVVIGGIVAIALAAGGGGGGRGGSTRHHVAGAQAIVEKALAAVSAGDLDTLVALNDPEHLPGLQLKCDNAAQVDPKKYAAHVRTQFARAIAAARGAKLELEWMPDLDSLDHPDGMTVPAGKPQFEGCVAAVDMWIIETTNVHVRVIEGDQPPKKRVVKIGLVALNERWYLLEAPTVMEGVENEPMSALVEDVAELARTLPAPAAGEQADPDENAGWPPECEAWSKAVSSLHGCPQGKMPKSIVEGFDQSLHVLFAKAKKLSAAHRAQLAPTCKKAADIIDHVRQPLCGF